MQNMQNKTDCFKLLVLWNKFLYYLAMFWMIIEKHANSYKSLALIIMYNILWVRVWVYSRQDGVPSCRAYCILSLPAPRLRKYRWILFIYYISSLSLSLSLSLYINTQWKTVERTFKRKRHGRFGGVRYNNNIIIKSYCYNGVTASRQDETFVRLPTARTARVCILIIILWFFKHASTQVVAETTDWCR